MNGRMEERETLEKRRVSFEIRSDDDDYGDVAATHQRHRSKWKFTSWINGGVSSSF